jgi:hypothetical protein
MTWLGLTIGFLPVRKIGSPNNYCVLHHNEPAHPSIRPGGAWNNVCCDRVTVPYASREGTRFVFYDVFVSASYTHLHGGQGTFYLCPHEDSNTDIDDRIPCTDTVSKVVSILETKNLLPSVGSGPSTAMGGKGGRGEGERGGRRRKKRKVWRFLVMLFPEACLGRTHSFCVTRKILYII